MNFGLLPAFHHPTQFLESIGALLVHASVSLHGAGPVTHEGGTGKQALDASLVLLVPRVCWMNECVSPPGVNEDVSTYTLVLILEGEPFSAYNMSVHGCGHERVITIMASRKAVAGSLALHCFVLTKDSGCSCKVNLLTAFRGGINTCRSRAIVHMPT